MSGREEEMDREGMCLGTAGDLACSSRASLISLSRPINQNKHVGQHSLCKGLCVVRPFLSEPQC